ncbi:uncharacterized protein [Argopecten irradians]|uniref:uncharacterized protein n=1 Tax=Argopecten irradians TaxID=31199 RepID=UPI00371A9322
MRSKVSTKDLSISILNPDPLFSALVNVRSHWSMQTNKSFSVRPKADHTFKPSSDFEVTIPGVSHKGIIITSDRPILVSGTNRADQGTYSYVDSYQAIPMETLGTSYYAVTAAVRGEILVVCVFNNTMVSITVKGGTIYHNYIEYKSGDSFEEFLDQYDTLLLYSSESLTGTHISSNNVITVYSGNQYVFLGGGSNFLVQQLAPVHRWSSTIHMLIPSPGANLEVIIVAAYADTVASIVCDESNSATNATLTDAGSSYLRSIGNERCTVSSNNAVSVTVILTGTGFDPVMIRIQPVVELTSTRSCMFVAKPTDLSAVLVLYSNTNSIALNNKDVPLGAVLNGFYTTAQIESKVHEIKCRSHDCWISAYIHAVLPQTKEAVGFPLHFIEIVSHIKTRLSNDEETTPIFKVTTATDQETSTLSLRETTQSPREVTHSPREVTHSPREVTHSPREVTHSPREVTHGVSPLQTTLWSLVSAGTTPSTRNTSPDLTSENGVPSADQSQPTVPVNNVVSIQWTTAVPTETTNSSVHTGINISQIQTATQLENFDGTARVIYKAVSCIGDMHSSWYLLNIFLILATTQTASVLNKTCACYGRSCQKRNYTREELENLVDELKQELMVKKETTSSHLRTLNSAPDHRTSSKVAGYTAGVILVTLAMGLLILDIPNLLSTLNTIRSNLCGTKPS